MLGSLTVPGDAWRVRFDRLDLRITIALPASAVPSLRIALGVVFLLVGALKFFPA